MTIMKPNYRRATNKAYELLSKTNSFSIPIPVQDIIKEFNQIRLCPYSYIVERFGGSYAEFVYKTSMSQDGFSPVKPYDNKRIICYNDAISESMYRFTLAHELGHFILGHDTEEKKYQEKEANCFARNLLCPFPSAVALGAYTPYQYSFYFNVSEPMASITEKFRDTDKYYIDQLNYTRVWLRTIRYCYATN